MRDMSIALAMLYAEDEWERSALFCIEMKERQENKNVFPGIDDLMIVWEDDEGDSERGNAARRCNGTN